MSDNNDRMLRKFDILGDPDDPSVKPVVRVSRAQLDRMCKDGRFPPPFHVGRLAFWKESTVQAWIAKQGHGKK